MFIRDVRQSYQIWSWYVVFIKLGLITDDQEYLKRTLKETQREKCPSTENAGKYGPEKTLYLETFHAVKVTWNKANQLWSWYVAFIEHSPIGDNHLKIIKDTFWKDVQEMLLYPYFYSLIPALTYALKMPIFQDSFCCNFLQHLIVLHSEAHLGPR